MPDQPTAKTLQEVSSSVYPKLERVPGKQNWVDKAGGLPSYIERIAKHLHFEKGKSISTAIAMAVNTVKKWATGFNHNGSKLKPDTVAKAQAAVAQWEAKKGKSKVQEAVSSEELDAEDRASLAGALVYRLSLAEGFARTLKGARTKGKSGALASAKALLEGREAKMVLGRGNVDPTDLARTQSRLGVEISELRATLSALELAEAASSTELGPEPFTKQVKRFQRKQAKGRSGQTLFDESKHPRAAKGRTGGGQFIKKGSSGPEVKGIQRRLGQKEDGEFGNKTAKAVRDFQAANKLKVDGKVGSQTAAALRGADAMPGPLLGHQRKQMRKLDSQSRYSKANLEREDAAEKARNKARKERKEAKKDAESKSDSSSSSSDSSSMDVIDSGSDIPQRLADLLKKQLGIASYDEAAIRKFQRENGLTVDGIIGTQTLAALRGDDTPPAPGAFTQADQDWLDGGSSSKKSTHPKPIPSEHEDSLPESQTVKLAEEGWDYHDGHWWPPNHPKNMKEAATKEAPKPVSDDHHRAYGAGMAGAPDEATALLQTRLTELGYDVGAVDGRYGERTKGAVEAFQGDHNLEQDGEVGANTKVALRGTDADEVARRRSVSEAEAGETKEGQEKRSAEDGKDESKAEETEEGESAEGEKAPLPKLASAVLTKGAGVDSDSPDPAVMAMQKAIGVEEDGWFGPASEKKLKATQRRYGLKADGVVGPKTGRLLDRINTKADESASKEERNLEEAVLARLEASASGDSAGFVRARARENLARERLLEASARSVASDALRDFYRLSDGTFAPKGMGRILRPGEDINLPHRSGKGTVRAKIEAGEKGKGLARIVDGPDAGRLAAVRTSAPEAKEPWAFPKPLKGKPSSLPRMQRTAGWDATDRYDRLNDESRAQSHLDQMNHFMDAGDHQAVQDYVDDARGEADHYNQFGGNAGKRWEEVEERGNSFLEGPEPQRAPIDFTAASDAELDNLMDEATSHISGVPMTARDRSIFQAVTQERTRRARLELKNANSPTVRERAASLIVQLTGKRPEGVPEPQHAPPEGYSPNESGKQIKDMAPGDTFYIGKYDTPFVLHKAVDDPYFVAKPIDGGKAKPFHKEMAPTFLGPHDDSYPASSEVTPANPDADLYEKLAASVGSSPKSPARSAQGNLRNFKAMSDEKLMGLALEMQNHPSDVEAIKAITAELNNRADTTKEKTAALHDGLEPVSVKKVAATTPGSITNALGEMEPGDHIELPNGTTVSRENDANGDYLVGGVKVPGGYTKASQAAFKAEGGSGDGKATTSKGPKTAEPAVNKSKDEKIAAAWGAYQNKKAEFDALPAGASKEERAKKAAQVRAAKFRIKRVGGDFEAGPPGDAEAPTENPPAKPKASKPKAPTLKQKIAQAVKDPAPQQDTPLSPDEVKKLVGMVPAGGYDAAFAEDSNGWKALATLNTANFKDLAAGMKNVSDKDLKRFYLTAEDANYHTLNEVVGDELASRGIKYGDFANDPEANGIEPPAAEAPAAEVPADELNLASTAGTLGGAWSIDAVEAALDQLEEQGLTFDRKNESPATLAAVIKAAGLDPAHLKTLGT